MDIVKAFRLLIILYLISIKKEWRIKDNVHFISKKTMPMNGKMV